MEHELIHCSASRELTTSVAMLLASLRRQHTNLDTATRREQTDLRARRGARSKPAARARCRARTGPREMQRGCHFVFSATEKSNRDFVSVRGSKPNFGFYPFVRPINSELWIRIKIGCSVWCPLGVRLTIERINAVSCLWNRPQARRS